MKPNNPITKQSHATDYIPTGTAAQRIMAERAKILAEVTQQANTKTEQNSYIRFELGKDHSFGIDFEHVKEVIHKPILTKMPLAPDYVVGVINYRGQLISIIDLNSLFALTNTRSSEDYHIIIVNLKGITLGFLTDFIDNSRSYNAGALAPALLTNKLKLNYVLGLHNGVTAILNMEVILSDFTSELKSMVLSNRHS